MGRTRRRNHSSSLRGGNDFRRPRERNPQLAVVRWILDDGPLGYLAQLPNPAVLASCEPGELLVSSTTAHLAAKDRSGRRQAVVALTHADGLPVIAVVTVTLGVDEPAAKMLADLHPDESATLNLAEHESIAWAAMHGRDAVFVTSDRRATVSALAELGVGRVAHPFDLWLHLKLERGLSGGDFESLCEATRRGDQGLRRMPARVSQHFG